MENKNKRYSHSLEIIKNLSLKRQLLHAIDTLNNYESAKQSANLTTLMASDFVDFMEQKSPERSF